jgi:aryl-alcohol dehydrogenase-like predicted oxidoreductase
MGMGCWGIGGYFFQSNGNVIGYGEVTKRQGIETVERAIELGINFFDTADVYGVGQSERILGEVVADYRDDIVIATKFGSVFDVGTKRITGSNASSEYIREALQKSFERLNTDYIDLYQLHIGQYDPQKAQDVMDTLEALVENGSIRSYGWSTDSVDRASIFAQGEHCSATQYRYNMIDRNDRMLEMCKTNNLASMLKGPMGYGLLTGKYRDNTKLPENHMWHGTDFSEGKIKKIRDALSLIQQVLTEDGRTLPQAAIGWLWARDETLIPIPGSKTREQIEENAQALEYGPLNQDQMAQIEEILGELTTQVNID